jgi:hypothetical protein
VHNQLIGIIRVKQQINKYRNIHLIIVLLHLYPSSWNNLENEKRIYPYIRIIFESWNHKIQTGFWIWIGFLKLQIGSLNLIWILSTKLDVKWEIQKKETTALGSPLLRASQSPCLGPTRLLPLAPTFSTSRTGPIAWPLLFGSVTRGPSMSVGWLCVPAETASCPLSLPHGAGGQGGLQPGPCVIHDVFSALASTVWRKLRPELSSTEFIASPQQTTSNPVLISEPGRPLAYPSLAIKPCREPCFPHHQERNRDRMECHRRWTTPRVGADRGSEEGPAAKVPVVRTSLGLGVIVAVFPPGIAGMPGP